MASQQTLITASVLALLAIFGSLRAGRGTAGGFLQQRKKKAAPLRLQLDAPWGSAYECFVLLRKDSRARIS
ncbi:MAG: hypothetical protein MK102_19715 [Fuerstiella sp.]|nr:hypothetical protein [Fuerstiella sp.]